MNARPRKFIVTFMLWFESKKAYSDPPTSEKSDAYIKPAKTAIIMRASPAAGIL